MNTYTENKSWIKDYLCILLDTSKAHIERGITKSYIWKELQNYDLNGQPVKICCLMQRAWTQYSVTTDWMGEWDGVEGRR